jgi:hypothetical protein
MFRGGTYIYCKCVIAQQDKLHWISLRDPDSMKQIVNIFQILAVYFLIRYILPIGERRKLHNEEPNDLYPSPNIVRIIKLRRMRWSGRVACWGEERCVQGFGGET